MPEGFKFKVLRAAILERSNSQIWEIAKLEWGLAEVFDSEEPESCLCGHHPINEICVLRNRLNKNITEVGNVCVKRFLGLRSDKIFDCLKRIRKNSSKALNAETIELFYGQGLISQWEREFSHQTMGLRSLSLNRINKRKEIAQKILSKTKLLRTENAWSLTK